MVSTCCYIARTYGVRSAMPMFEALRKCPNATVIRPNMAKYAEVGRAVRKRMFDLTPLVEPLSIDEAFLDLTGTERLHGMSAARVLARFAADVERDLGITVSVGLSANKFLAKIASDLDKPRGFAVLSQEEAPAFLAPEPVGLIFGVGAATAARLARDGYRHDRRSAARPGGRPDAPLRRGGPAAVAARARHRRPQGRSRARGQEHLGGDHFRTRHLRLAPAGADACGS